MSCNFFVITSWLSAGIIAHMFNYQVIRYSDVHFTRFHEIYLKFVDVYTVVCCAYGNSTIP